MPCSFSINLIVLHFSVLLFNSTLRKLTYAYSLLLLLLLFCFKVLCLVNRCPLPVVLLSSDSLVQSIVWRSVSVCPPWEGHP